MERCDNAPAERLWSRFKTEERYRRECPTFADLADAQASAAIYLTIIITTTAFQHRVQPNQATSGCLNNTEKQDRAP